MTVETERPVTLSSTPQRTLSSAQPSTVSHRGGWYDPDNAAWEDDAATVFEAFRADTALRPEGPRKDDGGSRRTAY